MSVREYILGTATYTVTGADPEGCLNRLTREGIPVWNINQEEPLTLSFASWTGQESRIFDLSNKACCQSQCTRKRGMKQDLSRALRRPALLLSLITAVVLSFLMEGLIWKIHIDADDPAIATEISHVLRDMGVDIWRSSKSVDPQDIRYALLNRVPKLSWVAVNPKGGKLTVLALSKESEEQEGTEIPCNLVACRDGVITESVVLEGMSLVKPGQSVKEGQILVSGIEDYGIYMKAVRATGEIYGQTWRKGTLIIPSIERIKHYTGRTYREINLIIGRKFINLKGSSSILGGTCDKMIDTEQMCLPGCPFPLYLQRVTYREYTILERPLPRDQAVELLCGSWENCLLSSMVAGRVEKTDSVCFEEGGLYIFCGESICHELLSRFMELEPLTKGEDPIGTDH